jgi:hypothetical protein
MKNLIKLYILVSLISLGTESFSQTFGIKAGLNLSNLLLQYDSETYSEEFNMSPGFHFGTTVEIPISEIFSFESGLMLSTKGFQESTKETFMGDTYEYKTKLNLFYLDIPLSAKATVDIGGAKIYGTFGPYIGMALSGKIKNEYTENGETETEEENVNWGSDEDEDDLKRLDYGLTAGAGIEFNSIQIGITYGLGLANISTYTESEENIKNRVLGISLGYKFGK